MAENIIPEWVVDPATGQKYLIVTTQSVDSSGNAVTDSSGNPAGVVMNGNITSWAGSGTGNAPTPSASTRVYGFDLDGIITAQMYFWDGDSWATLTGVTHDVFLGL